MTKARNIAELANDISVDSNRDVTLSNLRSDQPMMFRNKIINGDMRIDQRNAGGSVSLNSTFVFPVDRFRSGGLGPWSGSADIRAIQSTDAPAGFQNSLKIYTNTAASSSASDNYAITTNIEGYDITDINFGTNDAKSLNLSFYVKGTSGTYGLGFNCNNGMYVTTYTVTSNWNQIVISIPKNVIYTPDSLTNGYGCWIIWDLGAGSNFETTSIINEWQLTTTPRKVRTSSCIQFGSTTGAELYITGVQLEVGTVPTPFEHRPYGIELALCQRYCVRYGGSFLGVWGNGHGISTTAAVILVKPPVSMRATPSFSASGSQFLNDGVAGYTVTSAEINSTYSSKDVAEIDVTVDSGLTQFRPYRYQQGNSSAAFILLTSEL